MKRVFCTQFCGLLILLGLVLLHAPLHAATVTGVDVLEFGLYTYDDKVVLVEERQGTTKLSNIRRLKETLEIPLRPNAFFGIKFVLKSLQPRQDVSITIRVTNPNGEPSAGSLTTLTGVPTTTTIDFTELDPPGAYLLEILQDDRVLLSRTVTLIAP